MGRQKQYHIILQLHFTEVQQHISIGTAKEIKTEKIRLERPMLSQDTANILALACVNIEVYAALRFAERNAYQPFWVVYCFLSSCFFLSANLHYSFIKMAYLYFVLVYILLAIIPTFVPVTIILILF